MHKAIVIASLLAATAPAFAEPFSKMGAGVTTCANFNEASKNPALEETVFAWTQGYMSGINDALEDTIAKFRDLHTYSTNQQKLILHDYCFKHPKAIFLDAVNALMSDLTIAQSTLPNAPLHPLNR